MSVFSSPYTTADTWQVQNASLLFTQDRPRGVTCLNNVNRIRNAQRVVLGALNKVTVQYERMFTTQYPIGQGSNPIRLAGVPSGLILFTSLIGPTTDLENFLKMFGDACCTFTVTIKSTGRNGISCATNPKPQKLKCTGCSGQLLNYTLASDQRGMSLATGTFRALFVGMDWENN